mmetsp:Transcript_15137/g.19151  ORF Transcript_15137/g.19151 Transcript_15137/m.19151 type:complete len:113 (-) Transcript_15137:805-1143(-)
MCLDNPESPSPKPAIRELAKPKRASHFAAMDTSDLQSQDSTSFEVQSTRGASEICLDMLPSLASELEGLPKIVTKVAQTIAAKKETGKAGSVLKKLKSPDVKLNSVKSSSVG